MWRLSQDFDGRDIGQGNRDWKTQETRNRKRQEKARDKKSQETGKRMKQGSA